MRTFSYSLLDASDPDIKITAKKGKTFFITDDFHKTFNNITSIEAFSKVIEERVFLEYNDKSEIAFIKGVENNYTKITHIDSTLSQGGWLDSSYSKYSSYWQI